MSQRLDIDGARFAVAAFGGYDMEQVDDFLDDAKAHLAGLEIAVRTDASLPPLLEAPRFRRVLMQESYLASDVREYLAALRAEEDELRRLPRHVARPHGFTSAREGRVRS
jgi:DivIVA domain-containing protein